MIFLLLLLIPFTIALGCFIFDKNISWKEFLLQVGVQMIVAAISIGCIYWSNTHDVEVWNGRVTKKARERVSCSHSYTCNCTTSCSGSGSNQSCSTTCQTCYEHSYDVDWAVYTSTDDRIEIDRIDRQGLGKPARWEAVQMGEPTSVARSFTNYIKAAPGTLFRHQGLLDQYKDQLPGYPQGIYDYYRLDRVVDLVGLPDRGQWNQDLSEMNAKLGAEKQVNIILVVVKDKAPEYFDALEQAWLGGKKNDVVVVANVDSEFNIKWVDVMAWTDREIFKVKLRDDLMALGKLGRLPVMYAIHDDVKLYFVRKHMKDFEYLSSSVTPTPTEFTIAMLIGIIVSIVMAKWLHDEDVFGDEDRWNGNQNRYRYGYRR